MQSAYATWNANPCSVDGANGVTAAISAVVDQLRASNPTIQNIVIVGGDDQIPFARIADGASESNERDYGAATFAGENNVEGDALSLGYYFSDDPYAANAPLGVGSATLYLPQLAVGRLVESALRDRERPHSLRQLPRRHQRQLGSDDRLLVPQLGRRGGLGQPRRRRAQLIGRLQPHQRELDRVQSRRRARRLDELPSAGCRRPERALRLLARAAGLRQHQRHQLRDQHDGHRLQPVHDDRRAHPSEPDLVRGAAPLLDGMPRRARHRRRRGVGQRGPDAGRRLGQDLRGLRRALGGEHRLRLRRHRHDRLLGQAHGRLRRQPRLAHRRRGARRRQAAVRGRQRHLQPVRPEGAHGVDLLRVADVPPQQPDRACEPAAGTGDLDRSGDRTDHRSRLVEPFDPARQQWSQRRVLPGHRHGRRNPDDRVPPDRASRFGAGHRAGPRPARRTCHRSQLDGHRRLPADLLHAGSGVGRLKPAGDRRRRVPGHAAARRDLRDLHELRNLASGAARPRGGPVLPQPGLDDGRRHPAPVHLDAG